MNELLKTKRIIRMKGFGVLLIFLNLFFSGVNAQISNPYNLYFEDMYTINPAAVVERNNFYATMNSNLSHAGFENAPETYGLYLGGRMWNQGGLGLRLLTDSRGAFTMNTVAGTYAYQVRLFNENHKLHLGLSLGYSWQKFETGQITAMDMDDPVLQSSDFTEDYFVNDFGFIYTFKGLTLGASALYFIQPYQHYYAFGNYRFDFENIQGFELTPMVCYQYLPEQQNQADLGLKLRYMPVWTAVNYRTNENIIFSIGANLNPVYLAYSYEFNNNELSNLSRRTHEIMLSFRFKGRPGKASYDDEQ